MADWPPIHRMTSRPRRARTVSHPCGRRCSAPGPGCSQAGRRWRGGGPSDCGTQPGPPEWPAPTILSSSQRCIMTAWRHWDPPPPFPPPLPSPHTILHTSVGCWHYQSYASCEGSKQNSLITKEKYGVIQEVWGGRGNSTCRTMMPALLSSTALYWLQVVCCMHPGQPVGAVHPHASIRVMPFRISTPNRSHTCNPSRYQHTCNLNRN